VGSETEPVLRAVGVHKRFGGVHALRGAHITIRTGEVHGLTGENGSGKSTLLRILNGQLAPDAGDVEAFGRAGGFKGARDALHTGVATVSQETTLAPDLSIAENILLGHRMPRRAGVIDWRATTARAGEIMATLGLDLDPGSPVRKLRPDQAQMVEIARALSMNAKVLILDEPTSSLTDDAVSLLFGSVRRLCDHGVATVFVSHRLDEIFSICDRVTVLRDGRTVGQAPISEFDRNSLVSLMVGASLEQASHESPRHDVGDRTVLRTRDLSLPGAFTGVDLVVRAGEILGLAGLVGAGRTELLESLFGLHRPSGAVEVAGEPRWYRSPQAAMRDGVALVPADRKLQGLVLGMSVGENLLMASQSRLFRLRVPRPRREHAAVTAATQALRIRAASHSVSVDTLSGGNQQKVLLGKWLETRPRLLMLDEPTRGVDVGAKAEIYRMMRDARSQGIGIVLSSSETPELLAICDTIVVMFRGRVVATLPREKADEALITRLGGGHG
jgi:ABC-type sugar transport system ATPase subunit